MGIKRIQAGLRMSQAVVHDNVVYLAGQVCPPDVGATTVAAQTRATKASALTAKFFTAFPFSAPR